LRGGELELTERRVRLGLKVGRDVALILTPIGVIVYAAITGHWPLGGGLVP
jgi:hypothetical protein